MSSKNVQNLVRSFSADNVAQLREMIRIREAQAAAMAGCGDSGGKGAHPLAARMFAILANRANFRTPPYLSDLINFFFENVEDGVAEEVFPEIEAVLEEFENEGEDGTIKMLEAVGKLFIFMGNVVTSVVEAEAGGEDEEDVETKMEGLTLEDK